MTTDLPPERIADLLGLEAHPEGGRFAETWRQPTDGDDRRPAGTAIYFLLTSGERSRWHRIDSAEIWHYYAGAALELTTWAGPGPPTTRTLGSDLEEGERPQLLVDPGVWQSARSSGAWTLVGCTVSPGFDFDHFELAPDGWEPPRTS